MSDELVLTIDPPYIGSAVSPEVDITETDTTYTVDITDFRGVHSYTVEKTDQAIADAETAATNANTAAANATSTANQAAQYARTTADQAAADAQATADEAAGRADTAAASATSAAQAATQAAGTANTSAQNADAKAALADSKAGLANQAATTANQASQAAEAAKTAANTAAGQATTAAGNANTAAQTATTAAGNADAKAQLADTAAANADTATANANTATTNATNAAQAANNAADVAIEAAETITDGYFPKMLAGAAESLMDETDTATFAERVSSHDGVARIEAIQGNTVVFNQLAQTVSRTNSDNGISVVLDGNGKATVSGTASSDASVACVHPNVIAAISGHKYLMKGVPSGGSRSTYYMITTNVAVWGDSQLRSDYGSGIILTAQASGNVGVLLAVKNSQTVDSAFYPQFFDLTQMFGAGNEPSTVAEFESLFPETYYPYDAGSLLNVNMEDVRTVGFNQFDEVWESGLIAQAGIDSADNKYLRAKNYTRVFGGATYHITRGAYAQAVNFFGLAFYDVNKEFISRPNIPALNNVTEADYTAPIAAYYVRPVFGNSGGSAITPEQAPTLCINISNAALNGTYKPYTTDTREIPVSTYFPDGMKSAGSIHDELTMSKAVKRVGVVDLGALNWIVSTSGDLTYYTTNALKGAKAPSNNGTVANMQSARFTSLSRNAFIADTGDNIAYNVANVLMVHTSTQYESAAAFKAAMSGVLLHYELATPVETEITPPLTMTYTVENGGTESIVIPTGEQSAAPTMAIVYGLTADGVVDKALSVIAPIEGATASTNYSVNAYFVHDQQLYRVTSAIATGEAITPGTNCVACTVMGEVIRLTA